MQTDTRSDSPQRGTEPVRAEPAQDQRESGEEPAVTEELLVEEVSIDGMCGVY